MDVKLIEPYETTTMRLVKSEDLNHHGTLFAGRTAEWFVESGFVAATTLLDPKTIVCLKIHGMYFTKPVKPGEILKFSSKISYAGKSSIVAYIQVLKKDVEKPIVSGFVTFIHVDENTKPIAHHIEITPKTEEDTLLYEEARHLRKK
ncbi:MAG TPA: hotdog domain-containing protein [Bacteroidales bacterium]|jgi:acyl-CoA hydrolase|nr:hotdog domain-containing protein [Bacteroidales bacterium]